jgi:hypothetical protein
VFPVVATNKQTQGLKEKSIAINSASEAIGSMVAAKNEATNKPIYPPSIQSIKKGRITGLNYL